MSLTHNLAHQRFWFVAHKSIQVKGIAGSPVEIFEPIKQRQTSQGSHRRNHSARIGSAK